MSQFKEALQWRYATKRMNGEQVPQEYINDILEAIRMAPSSSGLQPYRVICITNRQVLEQIKPIAFNQPQITECTALLVFAAYSSLNAERINAYFKVQNQLRNMPDASSDDYRNNLIKTYAGKTAEEQFNAAARQAYIGLGFGLLQAAMLKVDTSPMEGFNNTELDAYLELEKEGLRSVVIMAIGYRKPEEDWLVNLPKARFAIDEFVRFIK